MSAPAASSEKGWLPIAVLGVVLIGVLYLIRDNLPPLILAGMMAYLLNPVVDIGERRRLPRWASIALLYLALVGVIVLLIAVLIPMIVEQIQDLKRMFDIWWPQVPNLVREAQAWLTAKVPAAGALMGDFQLDQRAVATVTDGATGILAAAPKYLTSAVSNVVNVVSYFVMVPFIAFFLIRDGRAFKSHLIELVPNRYFEMSLSILSKIEDQVGRYLRGILLEASAIGVMSSIGLLIIGLKSAIVVGLVAGVANLIPYLGPLVGGTVGVIVALSTGTSVMSVIIVFLVVQFVDNWVLQPVVMSQSVKLHPLLIFLAVVFGGSYGGILGMILAVPLMGSFLVTVQTIREALKPAAVQTVEGDVVL